MSKKFLISIIVLSIISGIIIAGCSDSGSNQITVPPTVTSTAIPDLVTIKGQALEINGTPIPNAFVVCVNQGLSASLSTLADNVGNYLFKNLPPGNYRIEIWRSEGEHNSSPGSPIGAVNITVIEGTITVNVTAGKIDPTATPTVTPAVTNTPTVTHTPSWPTNTPGWPTNTPKATNTPGGTTNTPTNTPTPSWKYVGNAKISAGVAHGISLYVYNGTPYISYTDFANGGKCTVMMYNGTAWNPVGNPGFSPYSITDATSLYIYNGIPYVAYADEGLTVKVYNGTNWVTVGNERFTGFGADYPSLYVYNGTPYVAFRDLSVDYKCTVMKFNGTNWIILGNSGISPDDCGTPSLHGYNETPYVAFNWNDVPPMKFNGTNWANVGTEKFNMWTSSLYVYSGTPYVAFGDSTNGDKARVIKYNGTSWVTVGNAGFSEGEALIYPRGLYIDNDETPYLAYCDETCGGKATVKKFDGTNWVTVGTAGFSPAFAEWLSLSVSDGIPYVGYIDWVDGEFGLKASVMKFSN